MRFKRPNGQLTEDGAREVLRLRAEGKTLAAIAKALTITVATAHRICAGKTWGWLR